MVKPSGYMYKKANQVSRHLLKKPKPVKELKRAKPIGCENYDDFHNTVKLLNCKKNIFLMYAECFYLFEFNRAKSFFLSAGKK